MEFAPNSLPSLNETATQDAIVGRLPPNLRHRWFEHQCNTLGEDGTVPFRDLASWFEIQARIMRRESFTRPSTTKPHQNIVPPSAARTYNTQDQNLTQESWRGSDTVNRGDNQGPPSRVPAGGPNRIVRYSARGSG